MLAGEIATSSADKNKNNGATENRRTAEIAVTEVNVTAYGVVNRSS